MHLFGINIAGNYFNISFGKIKHKKNDNMAIAFYAEDTKLPAIKKRAVGNWVKEVAATYGKKVGDISYIFCSDEKILEVNRQYLQHDYYTDIITFDYTSGNKISAGNSVFRISTKPSSD